MKPYYQDDLVTLYNGSNLDIREWLEADVLITDPPYGIDGHLSAGARGKAKASGHVRVHAKPDWDRDLEARDAVMTEWGGSRPYAVFGSPARIEGALPCREFPLIWDKGVVGMGDVNFPWGRSYELIYVNGPGWSGRRQTSVLRVTHASNAAKVVGHPSPKPIALMAALIRCAPPGVIADPFAGSGSTLLAAKQEGRRAIGVELNPEYCKIAAQRLAQDTLFGGVA